MDWLTTGATVVIAVAAVAGLWLRLRGRQDERRSRETQEAAEARQRAAQEAAHLVARTRPTGKPSHYELVITNQGPGDAHDVQVELDEVPIREHNHVAPTQGPQEPAFPLAAGSSVTYLLLIAGPPENTARIRLNWQDTSGGDSRETTVTFFG